MTDTEVMRSLNNAWLALLKQYNAHPDEGVRCGMNLLAKAIGKVRSEVEKSHREGQITMDEWIAILQKGI